MLTPLFSNQWNPELIRMKRFFPIAAMLLLCNAGALAQYTNILDGGTEQTVTNTWTTNTIWVGTSSSNNSLYVVDGGAITATNVYVGSTSNATGNTVAVMGTGTLYVEDTLTLGTGMSNSVSVSGGGMVSVGDLVIHSNNSFNVDSGGTFAISNDLDIAMDGFRWKSGGTIIVEDGNVSGISGFSGDDKTLVIDGGSWSNDASAVYVGIDGNKNQLVITNGGLVTSTSGYVGYGLEVDTNYSSFVSIDGNVVSNSAISISAASATVEASSGYLLYDSSAYLTLGLATNTSGSLAVSGTNSITLAGATNLLMVQSNLVVVNNGLFYISGDTNTTITAVEPTYVDASSNSVLVSGAGSTWSISNNLVVGAYGSHNSLVINGGGTVSNAIGYIGFGDNATNNSVTVSGAGSTWVNTAGELYVGAAAESGSSLAVTNDGWVYVGEATTNDIAVSTEGGILVASTNGAVMLVDNGSTVETTGGLYIGGTNAALVGFVSVTNGSMIEAQALIIGNTNSTLNLDQGGTLSITTNFNASIDGFEWNSGGALSVGGNLSGMAVLNNAYYLNDGRNLTLDGGTWDIAGANLVVGYGGSGSDLVVKNTGTLSSATTYIGWDTNSANNTITIQSGSVWNNSGDLWVGYGADENQLRISNAGTNIMTGTAYIGNTNTADNRVLVDGAGSLWDVGGSLAIGYGSNSVANSLTVSGGGTVDIGGDLTVNASNSLSLASGGSITVGGDMNVYSNASLTGAGTILFDDSNSLLSLNGSNTGIDISPNLLFDGGAGDNQISVSKGIFTVAGASSLQHTNFQSLVLNDSTLAGYGTLDGFTTIGMTGGTIDPFSESSDTATLTNGGTFTATGGTVYSAQVYENRNDLLVFTGASEVDLSNMGVDVLVVTAPTGAVTILSAPNLAGTFATETVIDRLLLYKAVLQITNNAVQVVLEEDPLGASMEFASTEMIRAGFNGMKNSVFTRTKQLRRNLVSTAHAIPNEVYLLTNTNAPAGAMGPGDQNTIFDMHIWMQQYSGQGDFDPQGSSDGFTLNNQGTMIGADRLIGEALVVGFNYTYARSSARTTGMDDLDSETYWLGTYGEWVGEDGLYVDAMAAYGRSNYDATRREDNDNYLGTASYRGQAFGAYADVGQYYYHGDLALSPYAGIHVLSILADGHSETEKEGSTVYVDEVNRDLVESAIGLKLRHRFDTLAGRFQTTGYAEWAHDFMEDDVSATLTAQGYPPVKTGIVSPDADTVNVGLGYSWISTDYMEVGIGYNGRFSENYEEHTGALMLDIMF